MFVMIGWYLYHYDWVVSVPLYHYLYPSGRLLLSEKFCALENRNNLMSMNRMLGSMKEIYILCGKHLKWYYHTAFSVAWAFLLLCSPADNLIGGREQSLRTGDPYSKRRRIHNPKHINCVTFNCAKRIILFRVNWIWFESIPELFDGRKKIK